MNTYRGPALVALLMTALLRVDASAETYHVVDIGTVDGFPDGAATGINDAGLVVGTLFASATITSAFKYSVSGGLVPLNSFGGVNGAAAFAVNDAGVAVGRSPVAFGGLSAVRWSSEGVLALLGSAASASQVISALAVNSAGEAVGVASTISFPPSSSARLWSAEGVVVSSLADAIGGSGSGQRINDAGQVAGTFQKTFLTTGAFRWSEAAGFEELLGLPDATVSSASGINEAGIAVGTSGTSSSSTLATSWTTPSQPLSLGVLSGGTRSDAKAINDLGAIVGFSDTTEGQHAIVWDNVDGMRDLNALCDAADIGMTLVVATAINASGQIAGQGEVAGHQHAFLATPVPEIGAAWPALAALLWLRRRRA